MVCTEKYLCNLFQHNGKGRKKMEKGHNRMKYNGWNRNMGERCEGDKYE
jgi:hypothetical protein